ncbi:DUF1338 domain-containing protein [Calothrix sp. NIES-3974]|uniref:DUF1338 domain-containing protein n=1 Tax=Calothrix sp. NIES-3974 TaxID=2005462 RepID=UPI000B5E0BFC|nr:DUF1338 domain-containing protein [Calothrix sp. NIES-3974]BAZ06520.1 hypothetical protein NIES3974_31810 [Calothrix sp. NIES-3974]
MSPTIINHIWQELWQEYLQRVPYARTYVKMITENGGTVANDHIAFRSLRLNITVNGHEFNLGIPFLETIIQQFGYQCGGEYFFPTTHLYARHYYHPQQTELNLPKLFLSELIVDELPDYIQKIIHQSVASISPNYLDNYLQLSQSLPSQTTYKNLFIRPWQPPYLSHIHTVNQISQYGAWVLLHGYAVNHFTGYVNQQNTPKYPDIQTTANGLKKMGVPMKNEIEGSIAVGLCQTATQAVNEDVTVIDDINNQEIKTPWTYAYYEIAERYHIPNQVGDTQLFDGFLGANAQHLFEMTKKI